MRFLLLSHKAESNTLLITHYEDLEKQSAGRKRDKSIEEVETVKERN